MSPLPIIAYVAAVLGASFATTVSTIAVPILVAVIMGGPAWITAKRAREEGLTVASLLAARLERIEVKLDDFSAWRAAHEALIDAEMHALDDNAADLLKAAEAIEEAAKEAREDDED